MELQAGIASLVSVRIGKKSTSTSAAPRPPEGPAGDRRRAMSRRSRISTSRSSAPSIGKVRATQMPPASIPPGPLPRQSIGVLRAPMHRPTGAADWNPRPYDAGLTRADAAMFEWSEEQQMVRDAVRQFVDNEIRPHREELEHGDLPPYDLLRKLFTTFGMDADGRATASSERIAAEESAATAEPRASDGGERRRRRRRLHAAADHRAVPVLARAWSPRWACRSGLTVGRDHVEGHDRAEGALGAATCSRSTRSARGRSPSRTPAPTRSARCSRPRAATATSTCSTARRRSSPTARTPTRSSSSASSTRATRRPSARSLQFVLDTGMPGLEQSKPLRKMGLHSSPTGELFLDDVRVGQRPAARRDRGRRRSRRPRRRRRTRSRWSAPASPRWRSASSSSASSCRVEYAKDRVQFGQPIGEFQLIQLKLAKMEVARLNVAEPRVPRARDRRRPASR